MHNTPAQLVAAIRATYVVPVVEVLAGRRDRHQLRGLLADPSRIHHLPAGRFPSSLTVRHVTVQSLTGAAEIAAVLADVTGTVYPLALRIKRRDGHATVVAVAIATPSGPHSR
jgi:hypothetical protein